MPEKCYHTLNTDSKINCRINFIYFLEITDCSNSNPPFTTFFEDPDPASLFYRVEEYPSNIGNSL